MSEFKRENRYWVLKLSDVEHLHYKEQNKLIRLCNIVASSRFKRGKPKLECVVIESDWPIYESAWDMVQRYTEGQAQRIDGFQRRIEKQNAKILRLEDALDKRDGSTGHCHNLGCHMQTDSECACGHTDAQVALNESNSESLTEFKKQIESAAVHRFVSALIDAFESGFVETEIITLAQLHRVMQNHVKDNYQVDLKHIKDEWGSDTAKACGFDVETNKLRQQSPNGGNESE